MEKMDVGVVCGGDGDCSGKGGGMGEWTWREEREEGRMEMGEGT
jgi:hypothetical protein